jgi:tetratricopeptide (TPR) repeat protein
MSDSELKDTQPNPPSAGESTNAVVPDHRKTFPRWLPAVVVVLLIVIGLLSGYGSGMGQRYAAQNTLVTGQLQEQFQLGQQAMDAGQYEIAKQHFEFIIQNNPNFPGVRAAYADLLIRMQVSPTPTFTPTLEFTSTPDPRGAQAIFANAQALISAGSWNDAIGALDSLRKVDPTYQTAQVDGMYYIALRQRGLGKILAASCKDINLEGGIYDLTQAEHFGPLDSNAAGLRNYARLYITAASFWDQDWVQAQTYFYQVMSALPSLTDSSCDSATERWRYATIKIAEDKLAKGDICGAKDQYDAAFSTGSILNGPYYPTATEVGVQCEDNGGPPADTPTPGGEPPTETPTPGS